MPQRRLTPDFPLGSLSYRELLAARARLERKIARTGATAPRTELLKAINLALDSRRTAKLSRASAPVPPIDTKTDLPSDD